MSGTAEPGGPAPQAHGFAAFLLSMLLSRLADQVLLFLVPLVVFQATDSVAWSGLAFAAEALPRFLAFPVCGALCDRVSPVRLLRISQLWRALASVGGALASLAFGGIGWLIGLSALCGVLTTQGVMAREVLLPQAFPGRRIERVFAHSQAADQAGAVLGPLLAALLLAAWRWEGVVCAAAGGFLLADLATTWWQRSSRVALRAPDGRQSWLAATRTAFGHVLRLPGLPGLVLLAAGVNLVVGVTLATAAALVTGLHAQSAGWYGGLQTAGAAATILVLLGVAHTTLPLHRLGILAYLLIFIGGLVTAFAAAPWAYALGYLLVIGFDKMFNVYLRSRRQKIIPPADFGKTTGVLVLLNNLTQPLAGLAVGAFAGLAGPGGTILVLTGLMGLLGLGVAVAAAAHTRH